MPHMLEEQEPGVYVRSNRPDQELDFLWDKDRKKSDEPDRFRLGFFAAGVVVGSAVTFAICLFTMGGAKNTPAIEVPIVEENLLQQEEVKPEPLKQADKQAVSLPFFSSKSASQDAAQQKPIEEPKARVYEVQSGDTLGSIAIKFYDSSSPEMIAKIQRANKMTNADTLSLGQRLVIPPKSY